MTPVETVRPTPALRPPRRGLGTDAETRRLARALLYGTPATRGRAVEELTTRAGLDPTVWSLLLDTARAAGAEPWQVRARSLEALGLAAGAADQPLAELILDLVCGPATSPEITTGGGDSR